MKNSTSSSKETLVFGKINYMILIVAILTVILGFFIMSGDTDIYSTTKITIAPVMILIGFGLGVYAILKKPQAK